MAKEGRAKKANFKKPTSKKATALTTPAGKTSKSKLKSKSSSKSKATTISSALGAFSKKDLLEEKVDQKDCVSVVTWNNQQIRFDAEKLDSRLQEVAGLRREASELAKKHQYDMAEKSKRVADELYDNVKKRKKCVGYNEKC